MNSPGLLIRLSGVEIPDGRERYQRKEMEVRVDLRITMLVNSTPPVGDLKMPWTSVRKANQATKKQSPGA